MRIPSASDGKHYVEPERAVDKTRTVLAEPWLEIGPDGTGTLFATDSYVAVRIPVELDDGDTPGVVPAAALKVARGNRYGNKSVTLNGSATAQGKDGTVTVDRPEVGDHPAVAAFFADLTEDDRTFTVMLDADKLAQVGKALGAFHGVKLTFLLNDDGTSTLKPIRVKRLRSGGPGGGTVDNFQGDGLLMPIKQKGTV